VSVSSFADETTPVQVYSTGDASNVPVTLKLGNVDVGDFTSAEYPHHTPLGIADFGNAHSASRGYGWVYRTACQTHKPSSSCRHMNTQTVLVQTNPLIPAALRSTPLLRTLGSIPCLSQTLQQLLALVMRLNKKRSV